MGKQKILVFDMTAEDRSRLVEIVSAVGLTTVEADSLPSALAQCENGISFAFVEPVGDGLQLQSVLAEFDKRSIPFACTSAPSSRDDLLLAMRAGCLDWIDKPVDAEAVRSALRLFEKRTKTALVEDRQKTGSATGRGLIAEIAKRIRDGNIDLPEVPSIIKELNALLTDLNVEAEAVQKVIEKDPSLSARLIATVNTATYGGQYWTSKITDLKTCVTRLGNQAVRNLVQTDAIKGMFQFRSPAFKSVFDKMWRCHFMSACLARDVAQAAGLEEPEKVYLVGLIHNVGELFLLRVFGELFQRQSNQVLSMDEVLDMVRDYHCVFGGALINKWELGEDFAFVTKEHHTLDSYRAEGLDESRRKLIHCINLADQLVNYTGAAYYSKSLPGPSLPESYDVLQIDPEAKDKLRHRAEEMYNELFG